MLLSVIDYLFQGMIALLVIVYPWFVRPAQSSRVFQVPFFTILIWGMWRMFYFDPVTNNDIPGAGYIFAAVVCALMATLLFVIRCAVLHTVNAIHKWRRARHNNSRIN